MGNDRQRAVEMHQTGSQHHDNRDFERAVQYYKAAVDADPSYEPVYNDLSVALFSLKRHEEALPYIQRAYQGQPHHIPIVCNLLSCLNRLEQHQEARRILDTVVNQGLDVRENFSWPMIKVVGDIYFMTNSMAEALPFFESVLTQYPDNYNCLMKAAFCRYEAVQLEHTLGHLKKIRKVAPDCAIACVQMARCYRDCGLPGMAAKYCRLSLENDPNFRVDDLSEFYC